MYDLVSAVPGDSRHHRSSDPEFTARWYACYTRARHEKQVESRLLERSIESFCPMLPQERRWHDRVKRVDFPLFPSYVFVRCSPLNFARVVSTAGVVTVVSSNGAPVPIPAEEIDNVRRFASAVALSGGRPEAVPLVEVGTPVRIVSGPFAGVVGRVVERRGRDRVLVGLDAIAQSWEIEVPAGCMVPLTEGHATQGAVHRVASKRQARRKSHV